MDVRRRLSEIGERIARARREAEVAAEQVAFQAGVVEEARVSHLVSETPLARREYREALGDLERLTRHREGCLDLIRRLKDERDRLLDEMADPGG